MSDLMTAVLVDGKPINYDDLPELLRDRMQRYIEDRRPPGSFLRAVLENDLSGACATADNTNILLLSRIVRWLRWNAPSDCHGSAKKFSAWLNDPDKSA